MKISRRDFLKKAVICGGTSAVFAPVIIGCRKPAKDIDVLIKKGLVVDGTGNKPKAMDLGIKGDRIRYIGPDCPLTASRIINAEGLTVSPGFIDVHSHTDTELLVEPSGGSKLMQGVTTDIGGNCGSSIAPLISDRFDDYRKHLKEDYDITADWKDFSGFFRKLKSRGIGINFCTLLGHSTLRTEIIGNQDKEPSPEELDKMKKIVENSMKEGVFGISTGLEYVPGSFAKPDEITALAKIASKYNGVYATHMRNEDDFLEEAVKESINTAQNAGISLQISHLKASRKSNWHKTDKVLKMIHDAEDNGLNVDFDRYPYTAFSTGLSNLFPIWTREGGSEKFIERLKNPDLLPKIEKKVTEKIKKIGSWDFIMISSVKKEQNKKYQGKTVEEIIRQDNLNPFEFVKNLIIEEENRAGMVGFAMSERNTKKILSDPLCMPASDGSVLYPEGPLSEGNPHPRNYGTFPRVIGKYSREEDLFPQEELIRKITSAPAKKFGIKQRGLLTEGFFADITIFDYQNVIDKASFTSPHQFPQGIHYVIVNGKITAEKNNFTGNFAGRILKLNP